MQNISRSGSAFSKSKLLLIILAIVSFLCILVLFLEQYFIVETELSVSESRRDSTLNQFNKTFNIGNYSFHKCDSINESKNVDLNNTNTEKELQCNKLLSSNTYKKVNSSIDKYEQIRTFTKYLTKVSLYLSFLLLISLFVIFRFNVRHSLIKKIIFFTSVVFTFLEFTSLMIYISIYLKTLHIHNYLELVVNINCPICLEDILNTELLSPMLIINSLIASLKFIYSCAIAIIVINFALMVILLYTLKLLIVLNAHNHLHNSIHDESHSMSEIEMKPYSELTDKTHSVNI